MIYRILWMILAALCIEAQPAGTRPASRSDSGESVLPGGRLISPVGSQYFTGPGPFGLAVRPSGRVIVTADGGPNRYALTVLEDGKVRHFAARRKRDADDKDDDDDADWYSVFMGLAFSGEHSLYASEGESGRVRLVDLTTGKRTALYTLEKDAYSGDLAFDAERGLLYVVDQANFKLAIIDTRARKIVSTIRTGRLPFAIALAPDRKTVYVTNLGMFEYRAIPGADPKRAKETGLLFPAAGFPSRDAEKGVRRETESGPVEVPGLGAPNARGANSLAVIDVADAAVPRITHQLPTGLPFGGKVFGGSSPSGVVASAEKIFVSNANQDTISVFDARTLKREPDIELRIPGYESLRGALPIGMAFSADGKRLLVAEAGINALGVVDIESRKVLGHVPVGWFPARVQTLGDAIYVANAKGNGTGPNADREAAFAHSFQGELRRGSISRLNLPRDLTAATQAVMRNNGFLPAKTSVLPRQIEHVVIIVKENRTYDEVFGDLPNRNGAAAIARYGAKVTPNHHAIATRFSSSDNFYADSEVSVDGHHWLAGSYPNAWTTSTLMAAYGGQKTFRFPTEAPGRLLFAGSDSSVHPEEQLEAGAIWHHFEKHGVSFFNFGEGFELAGVNEGENLQPTGARFLTNIPISEPLYRNTSRQYPGFNMNIPDQYRASQFISEMDQRFRSKTLPGLLFIHLPNDHTAKKKPESGYPSEASYVADNDLALGRILEYLSHSAWWPKMAVFVTEDDAQSGVDHVDSHRTVLLVASPYARRDYTSHVNASFPSILKTAFELLHLPPLNLYDAAAADLSDCFTAEPDLKPYDTLPVDPALFDPKKARISKGAGPKMDDPAEIRRQHRRAL